MRFHQFTLLISICFWMACNNGKNSTANQANPTPPATEATVAPPPSAPAVIEEPFHDPDKNIKQTSTSDSLMRFITSFYSIGSGSESEMMDKLKVFIASFEKKVAKKIVYTPAPWGREGEVDYCFPLKDLTPEQQEEFIKGSKEVLSKAQWVHYFENKACRKPR